MADAIPVSDAGLLAAQAKAGQAGVDAYNSAISTLQAQKQSAVQTALQEAAMRGSPQGAAESQSGIISTPYDQRIASLTQGLGNYQADMSARNARMNDYNQATLAARSYIPQQVEMVVGPIRAQGDFQVRNTQMEGEQRVAGINADTELTLARMAAAFQAAQIAAAKKAAEDAAKAAAAKAPTAVQLRSELVEGARSAVGQAHEQATSMVRQTGEQNRLAASYAGQSAQYANRVKGEAATAGKVPVNPNAFSNEMMRQAASYAGQSAQYAAMQSRTATPAQQVAQAVPKAVPSVSTAGFPDMNDVHGGAAQLFPVPGVTPPSFPPVPESPTMSNWEGWSETQSKLHADQLRAVIRAGNQQANDYGKELTARVAQQSLPRVPTYRPTATTDETPSSPETARQLALNIAPGYRQGMFTPNQREWVSNLGLGTGANLFNAPPLAGQDGTTRPIFGTSDVDELLGGALNRDTGQRNSAASDSFRQAMLLVAGQLQDAGIPLTDAAITGALNTGTGIYKPGDSLFDVQSRFGGGSGVLDDTNAAIKAADAAQAADDKLNGAGQKADDKAQYDAVRSEFYGQTGKELPVSDPVIGTQIANVYSDPNFQAVLTELRSRLAEAPPTKDAERTALIDAVLNEAEGLDPNQRANFQSVLNLLTS